MSNRLSLFIYSIRKYKNFLRTKNYWRQIDQTLCTFLTSKKIIEKYWNELISMCKVEHYPFEKPLHSIYKKELCISPIPSLAVHFTNVNSIYGLSPNVDWKKLWDEMKIKTNKKAPNFQLDSTSKKIFELSNVKDGIVIYFYPKDNTPVVLWKLKIFQNFYKKFKVY